MNAHLQQAKYQSRYSNNDVFAFLLQLTQLDTDQATLIKLFEEQGLEICEHRIKIWSTPVNQNGRPIPDKIFAGFMNILDSINKEALTKEINMFDLSGILVDLRD